MVGTKVELQLSDFSKKNENIEIKIKICETEMETEFF
jgi:hypothetical protein